MKAGLGVSILLLKITVRGVTVNTHPAPDMSPVTVTSCCLCSSCCLCCPSAHLLYFGFSGYTHCLLQWAAYSKGLFVFIQLIKCCGGAIFSIMGRWSDKPTARQQPAAQHTDTTSRVSFLLHIQPTQSCLPHLNNLK